MRLHIDKETVREGLIFKTTFYAVTVTVEFTEEEKVVIRANKLEDTALVTRPPSADCRPSRDYDPHPYNLLIEYLLSPRGDRYLCINGQDADEYERVVLREAEIFSANLKRMAEGGDGRTTHEF